MARSTICSDLDYTTVENIQREYRKDNLPWNLGFSGGKDSSALLKLLYVAIDSTSSRQKTVTIMYCDSGVEIPIIHNLVLRTIKGLVGEAKERELPLAFKIVRPRIEERYFARVIGRGYPPPDFKFRWCTDVLRIRPINRILRKLGGPSIILLGMRKGESIERDKLLLRHLAGNEFYFKQVNNGQVKIYSPIINYSVEDVWNTILSDMGPKSIDAKGLKLIYRIVHSSNDRAICKPNLVINKGRFGCWTCTVVRRDRATENLVLDGHTSLKPLLEFRNWLVSIRNDKKFRCKKRRNGTKGLGPFTIEAREEILRRLISAQSDSGWELIEEEELQLIQNQWRIDKAVMED